MKENVPTLLSLADIKKHALDIRMLENCVVYKNSQQKLKLINGFLVQMWNRDDNHASALFTADELTKLHRSFGHPAASSLANVLRKARPAQFTAEIRNEIQRLTDEYSICEKHSRRPRRFKLTLGPDDLKFNSIVAIDFMYLSGKPVLHAVDEATHFTAALFLRSMSSEDVWKALVKCWSDVYLGPPDFLRVDQGSNFVSNYFRTASSSDGIELLEAPIESPSTMSHVERYHAPLRASYEKLRMSTNCSDSELLQMAVRCVNQTVGPEGLCPALLVFGCLPRPARATAAPSQLERSRAFEKAMDEVQRIQAQRRVEFGLRYTGPYGRERFDLDNLTFGSKVLVFRDKPNTWEGPYMFMDKDNETVVVQLPSGRKIFRSHAVKPFKRLEQREKEERAMSYNEGSVFHDSRKNELQGLLSQGVFEIIRLSDVEPGAKIYKT